MGFVFREIRNKSWWDKSHDQFKWLPKDELIGDVFKALGTMDGSLSTFLVDADLENVDRIAVAFACLRDKPSRVDYALIPMGQVESLSTIRDTPAKTPDDKVNGLHLDIVDLTHSKLVKLAFLIDKCPKKRVTESSVKKLARLGIENGNLKRDRIRKEFLEKLYK